MNVSGSPHIIYFHAPTHIPAVDMYIVHIKSEWKREVFHGISCILV
ncbi:MAG: hypothetical protein NVSMB27_34230 [Ktedonobacteraceae bacterium]